jgi:hypothetical protein
VVTVEQATELAKNAAAGLGARIAARGFATAGRLSTAAGLGSAGDFSSAASGLSGTAGRLAAAHFATTTTAVVTELREQTAQAAATTGAAAVHLASASGLSNTARGLTTTGRLATPTTEPPKGVGVLGAGEHEGNAEQQRSQNGTALHLKHSSKIHGGRGIHSLRGRATVPPAWLGAANHSAPHMRLVPTRSPYRSASRGRGPSLSPPAISTT